MTTEDRITELEAQMEDLQEQLNMAYDDLDRCIMQRTYRQSYDMWNYIVAAVVGAVQITIAVIVLLK